MTCPRCASVNVSSLSRIGSRRPVRKGRVIIRQHRCGDCSNEFRSYQLTVSNRATADAVAEALDVA